MKQSLHLQELFYLPIDTARGKGQDVRGSTAVSGSPIPTSWCQSPTLSHSLAHPISSWRAEDDTNQTFSYPNCFPWDCNVKHMNHLLDCDPAPAPSPQLRTAGNSKRIFWVSACFGKPDHCHHINLNSKLNQSIVFSGCIDPVHLKSFLRMWLKTSVSPLGLFLPTGYTSSCESFQEGLCFQSIF